MLKKRFFKTKQEVEIAFEIDPADAEKVDLVCEVNGWEPVSMKKGRNGTFRTRMRMPLERKIQFRYLVNGHSWVNDETADGYCVNEFGGKNGILDTTPAG